MLCRKVFASFVETWNYIVNRIENLKGDADANPRNGHIKIDNTDPEHPIMRLVNIQDFRSDVVGGGGAFSYDPETHTIKDGMYLRARTWYEVAEATVSARGYAYLEVGMEATSFTASIVTGASSIPAQTRYKTYVPLYWFNDDLEPTHDYRGAPTIQIWEYFS